MPYDSSQTRSFLTCPQQYAYTYVEQIRKITDDKYDQPKRFGSAFHAGAEAHYLALDPRGAFLALFPQAHTADEPLYTPEHGGTALDAYVAWAKANWAGYTVLAVEKPMIFPLAEGIDFLVKPDGVMRHPETGIWGRELKTTVKVLNEDYWRNFENSDQITAIAAGIQHHHGQCSGVMVEGLRIGYRQRMYKGEPAGFYCHLQRQIFNRTPAQIGDWAKRRLRTIRRMEASKVSGEWEKNQQQCVWCPYMQLCLSVDDPGVKEVLYEAHDPYAYLKESVNG